MKKVLILVALLLFGWQLRTLHLAAEDLYYPFDSITIVEAFKFEVQVLSALDSDSLLYGSVDVDDVLTIYVGTLSFVANGVPSSGSANIIIVSKSDGTDLVRFLVNNYSFYPDVSRSWGFASHILIDPLVGVHKDLSIVSQELIVIENIALGTWRFVDNKGGVFEALPSSFMIETDLSILISAYTGSGE
jgi:hypothetical protein